jgi:2-amino-4-hydroxy-6-hydroxymethyldihydropteridine diphosphokinase
MRMRVFIGIGSNVGDRRAQCVAAEAHLRRLACTDVLRVSPLIETPAAEGVTGGPFLNGVAEVDTGLAPLDLLQALQAVEAALGRPRGHCPGTARTMDLDILLYGDHVVREVGLDIPHPRMAQRRFVLEPLVAIAPSVRHPILHLTAADLLRRLEFAGSSDRASLVP